MSPLVCGRHRFDGGRAYIVGVLNVTPDSFSDGGVDADAAAAIARGLELARDGADIVDIGGESTRPQQAVAVDAETEARRVVGIVAALAAEGVAVSIDTTKAAVAEAALAAGAVLVNDISGGLFDPQILEVTARASAGYVLGHVRGTSLQQVHSAESEPDPLGFDHIASDLRERLERLPGGLRERTIVDPGLGFGKGLALNLELTRRSGELAEQLGRPVMLGPSRKRYIGELTGAAVAERDPGTVGAALAGAESGALFLRVHDVKLLKGALVVYEASRGGIL